MSSEDQDHLPDPRICQDASQDDDKKKSTSKERMVSYNEKKYQS